MPPKIRKTPSYLTKNRFDIYSFQTRLPLSIIRYNPSLKPIVRFSLKTCDRALAVRLARRKIAVLDAIKHHFSNDSKSAGRAVELWVEYERVAASSEGWDDVDSFLAGLDDGDSHLLDMVLGFSDFQSKQAKLIEENQLLKAALSSVSAGSGVIKAFENEVEEDILLSEVCDKFIGAKKANNSAKSSVVAYDIAARQFMAVLHAVSKSFSLKVSGITAAHIRRYVELMPKMPKHSKQNGVTNNMSGNELVQFIDSTSEEEMAHLGLEVLSSKTVGGRFTIVRELMRFIEQQQYTIKPGLGAMIKYSGNAGDVSQVSRRHCNAVELKQLFESENYRLCKFKDASDYWVPLLALFSGATQSELLQLHVDDVFISDGIWAIDINSKGDKRLKTRDGRPRQFPVHNQLLKLGFDRFVDKCRAKKQIRLFPNEKRDVKDQFGSYSKRFNRYRVKVGVGLKKEDKVDFHSFRHLAASILIGKGVDEGVVNDIIGHASAIRSEARKTYSNGAFMKVKAEALKKLKYDINFKYTKFWR